MSKDEKVLCLLQARIPLNSIKMNRRLSSLPERLFLPDLDLPFKMS
jgi:hypothetical protein